MEISTETKSPPAIITLRAIEATPESFKEYGQVIEPSADGDEFGPHDAQLDLSQGTPRFYIMRLEGRSLKFGTITHHARVTQCLGAIGGGEWYLGLAKASIREKEEGGEKIERSKCGHLYVAPSVEEVKVFKISGPKFVKLDIGTWHAGPLFNGGSMDFYNLELSNTNVVDHTTHSFKNNNQVVFSIED